MKVHIRHGDVHLLDLRTRMPFRYGIATMTAAPHAFVRVLAEIDGRPAHGIAADHLPPRWFTKDPNRSLHDEVADMLRVIANAVAVASELRADTPFEAWLQLFRTQDAWGREERLPPLLVHFGTSLVERAILEAACRAAGRPLGVLLREGRLGMRLGTLHPELSGSSPAEHLPENPLTEVIVRHTVGLADPLVAADIHSGELVQDGLPQTLADCVERYGLRHFKIKLCGEVEADQDRLRRLAALLDEFAPADYRFSLDGNEHFHDIQAFRVHWETLSGTEELQPFLDRLLFVEQPLHRDVALDPEVAGPLRQWTGRPPLIIDESDAELTSLPQALSLGYDGTSHKNCKGVFKGIANACLLAHRRRDDHRLLLTGEDLATIGPVSLLQDLAVCANLGIHSVERNGHHYFAGLSMFPQEVQSQVLLAHSDLYHLSPSGWPTLSLEGGLLQTGTVTAAPFGVGLTVPVEQFLTLDAYRKRHGMDA